MNTYPNARAAKIAARNKLHTLILDWVPRLQAALAPFVGTKAQNAGGELCQKVRKALPELPCTPLEHIWVRSDYGIIATFQVGVGYKEVRERQFGSGSHTYEGCQTQETSVVLAHTANGREGTTAGTLTELVELKPEHYRTDYTEAEVIAAREQLKKAKEAVSAAERALAGFGEHDR